MALRFLITIVFLALLPFTSYAEQYATKVHSNGPDETVIESGGKITVKSGGTVAYESGAAVTRAVTRLINASNGRVGGTAGFTNAGNTGAALCPASQTASKWVIPITNLRIGDTVTAFKVTAQIESAGGTATLDADLRILTNAAGDPTDASLGAITQVSVTADTAVGSSKTLAAAETIASGETLYLLVTVTTAASTDVQLLGLELSVTEA